MGRSNIQTRGPTRQRPVLPRVIEEIVGAVSLVGADASTAMIWNRGEYRRSHNISAPTIGAQAHPTTANRGNPIAP